MRIVSWNCNGAFRKKHSKILSLDADIYVIQECENPDIALDKGYINFSDSYVWTGENKNKGLGIFSKNGIDFKETSWPKNGLRNFTSICIHSEFNLLGVWACRPYIEEYYLYQKTNFELINENTVIIGDFNSNSIWDQQHGQRNHSAVVKELEVKGLFSAYHYLKKEEQGKETEKTFYLHKNPDKAFHIDYCFLAPQRIEEFNILAHQDWLEYSDHMPIVIDIK